MIGPTALIVVLWFVCGYYFFTKSRYFQFRSQQVSGQHLLFSAVLWGIPFLVIARLVCWGVAELRPGIYYAWHGVFPIAFLGTALSAIVLAICVTHGLNLRLDQEPWLAYWVQKHGTELEQLILQIYLEEDLVLLTLDTGKVYVGQIASAHLLRRPMAYLELLTMASGYRKEDTHEVIFQFDYEEAYSEAPDLEELAKRRLLIPIDRIVTASFFDPGFHQRVKASATEQHEHGDSEQQVADLKSTLIRYGVEWLLGPKKH